MPGKIRVSGTWKDVTPHVKVGGAWKTVLAGYTKVSGVWKKWYELVTGLLGLISTTDGRLFSSSNKTSYALNLTSADPLTTVATNWATATSNFGEGEINSIAYGNNLWIAGGSDGQIRTSNASSRSFNDIAIVPKETSGLAEDKYLVAGNNGYLYQSSNGSTWTTINTGITDNINVINIDRQYLLQDYTSLSATNVDAPSSGAIAYGNGIWLIAGQTYDSSRSDNIPSASISTDRITWTTANINFYLDSPEFLPYGVGAAAYGNGRWLVSTNIADLYTSTNGSTWTQAISAFGFIDARSIIYANGLWIAGGNAGQMRTSTDGLNWTTATSNFGTTSINSIAYGDGLWVAVGFAGQIRTSTDGSVWTTVTSNFGTSSINSVIYANSLWIAGGEGGQILTSANGSAWTTVAGLSPTWPITKIAYSNGIWVALRPPLTALVSYNGSSWLSSDISASTITNDGNNKWLKADPYESLSINMEYDKFKAASTGNNIRISTNLTLWTTATITNQYAIHTEEFSNLLNNSIRGISSSDFSTVNRVLYGDNGLLLSYNPQNNNFTNLAYPAPGTWTTANANFGSSVISCVAYNNGLWIIGGAGGTMATSTNSTTWTIVTSNFGVTGINSIAYGNGLWVAVGNAGQIRTSNNGSTWNTVTSNFGASNVNSIAYGNGVWVAGGSTGQIRTSNNGSTWNTVTSNFGTTGVLSVAYGDGAWLAMGSGSTIGTSVTLRRSTNGGTTWATISNSAAANAGQVHFANGRWVLTASSSTTGIVIRTSTNGGLSWGGVVSRRAAVNSATSAALFSNGNLWLIATNTGVTYMSTDGFVWTDNVRLINQRTVSRGIAYGNGNWVVVRNGGVLELAPQVLTVKYPFRNSKVINISAAEALILDKDSKSLFFDNSFITSQTWTTADSRVAITKNINLSEATLRNLFIGTSGAATAIEYGNGMWVAGGTAGQLRNSTDAVTWNTVTSNFAGTVSTISYGNGTWVAGTTAAAIANSTDTTTWSAVTSNFANTIHSIKFGNNIWVAVGRGGDIRTSNNGSTWTTVTSNFGTGEIRSLGFGNGVWVAGSTGGDMRTSTNGSTWVTVATSNFGTTSINSIAYGNGLWLAGGGSANIRASRDTVNWTTVTPAFPIDLSVNAIAYSNGLWIAGASNALNVSTDGISWHLSTNPAPNSVVNGIAYGNGLWVYVISNVTLTSGAAYYASQYLINDIDSKGQYAVGDNSFLGSYNSTNNSLTRINVPGITDNFEKIDVGDNGDVLIIGDKGSYYSTDLVTWTTVNLYTANENSTIAWTQKLTGVKVGSFSSLETVAYGNGTIVALRSAGHQYSTDEGLTWSTVTGGLGSTAYFVGYSNGYWVMVSEQEFLNNEVRQSTNGITWTSNSTVPLGAQGLATLSYGNGIWVVTNRNSLGSIYRSTDFTTWENVIANAGEKRLYFLKYDNGVWLGGGVDGHLRVSSDNMTSRTQPVSNFGSGTIYSGAYGNGVWVIVGASGQIRRSTDTVTWTTVSSGTTENILGIEYTGSVFVAGCPAGILLSTDGSSWRLDTTETSNYLTYRDGLFVSYNVSGVLDTGTFNSNISDIDIP